MKLKGMLEASIQRRFPKGLKVRLRSLEKSSCLRDLAQRLRAANLSITRAKVCPTLFAANMPVICKCNGVAAAPPFTRLLSHAPFRPPHPFSPGLVPPNWSNMPLK